jgi:valyl-tRNA synthetase
MPFVTEELWGLSAQRDRMCAHADWPAHGVELVDPAAEAEMRWAIAMIEGVRSARAQMNVPAGLYVPLLQLEADAAAKAALRNNEALIKRLARIGDVTEVAAFPKGTITVALPGATYGLPLAEIVDVAAEKARVGKVLEKLGKELAGLRGRLNNPGFVASAPAEVVAEARANLALREEEEAQLKAALARLAEIG